MQESHPPDAPRSSLRERLPLLARQLDVCTISVFVRPVLVANAADAPLHLLLAAPGGVSELPPSLARELSWLGPQRVEAGDTEFGSWLRSRGFAVLQVLAGPRDRAPSVFFLCFARRPPRPRAEHERLARGAIEALCARLAPPPWLPLAPREAASAPMPPPPPTAGLRPLSHAVEEVERLLLRRALRVAEGNKSLAARSLRMTRAALYRKLRRYGLLDD